MDQIEKNENITNSEPLKKGDFLPMVRTKLDWDMALYSEEPIKTPQDVIELISRYISDSSREMAFVVCSDVFNRPICIGEIGIGIERNVELNPKIIMQFALLANASYITIIHNHPSVTIRGQQVKPSPGDLIPVKMLAETCILLGMELYDSIVIGNYRQNEKGAPVVAYYSFREKKQLNVNKTVHKFRKDYLMISKREAACFSLRYENEKLKDEENGKPEEYKTQYIKNTYLSDEKKLIF